MDNQHKCMYKLVKWRSTENHEIEKSWRERVDMRVKLIEHELVQKHEETYGNKREICSKRLANRRKVYQTSSNPYMYDNNYLDDLKNQEYVDNLKTKQSWKDRGLYGVGGIGGAA